ncbi:TRAP transporter large permease subunit [Thermodesulfobacteriota bacterium]
MEWQVILVLTLGGFLVLMALGMPVAFSFMLVNLIGVYVFFGGTLGLEHLIDSIFRSVINFVLVPIPLFILMGEVMFHSGVATQMIDALDKWTGRIPGRLSIMAVAGGTLFATMSGASMASVAMLGKILVPEMEKRGYDRSMSMGPILGSSLVAGMIPPSSLAVLMGGLGRISIGKILVAIIVPGLLMSFLYALYIIIRCKLQPSIAPSYDIKTYTMRDKILTALRHILPVGFIIFMVVGVMFLGVASPSEAAATGAIACFIVAFFSRRLTWNVVKTSMNSTLGISTMIFMVIVASHTFSEILAFSGASKGLLEFAGNAPLPPIFIIVLMQIVLLVLGMFMAVPAIIMITTPLYIPIIKALGFDPAWFVAISLITLELGCVTPPYGLNLLIMKSVAPEDTPMGDIIRSVLPYIGICLVAVALIIIFPGLALWLPGFIN